MDQPSEATFLSRKLPTMRVGLGGANASSSRSDDFRWQFGAFRAYGVTKADVIIWLLKAGRDACITDVDAAWVATPYALLASLPEADVALGTDCLHIPEDDDRTARDRVIPRCGHHVGSRWHAWFNTGVLFFRAGRPAALEMAVDWRERMAGVTSASQQVDDQLTFNQMVGGVSDPKATNLRPGARRDHIYPVKAARPDGKVMFAGPTGAWKVAPLSARAICTAHRYHIQQAMSADDCLILHLTFVEGWPKNPAKFWRLREAGLFPVDPEEFSGKFLTFTPPQPGPTPPERHVSLLAGSRPMPDLTKDQYGRGVGWSVAHALKYSPRLNAHVDLVDQHIAALRNAMGIATALGRTLVMPRFMCMCERAESPFAILPACIIDGASTPTPHVCPLESLFDVARDLAKVVPLRPWTFLNASLHKPPLGQRAFHAPTDVTTVRWRRTTLQPPSRPGEIPAAIDANATAAAAATAANDPTAAFALGGKKEIWLAHGSSDEELKASLAAAGASDARVLHLESASDGAFGGFESSSAGNLFQQKIMNNLLGGWSATWCCTSNDKPRGTIQFKRPRALPTGTAARAAASPSRLPDVPAKRVCYWVDNTCNDKP